MSCQHTPVSRTGIAKASVPDGPNPFAVHGDPSRRDDLAPDGTSSDKRRIRWARPTDLHHDPKVAERLLNGVDLEARLVRWARGLPVRGVRKLAGLGAPSSTPRLRGAAHEGPVLS